MIETIGTIATVIAIAGVVLNNHRHIGCFYLWLVSNALSAVVHLQTGVWSMTLRDVIFLGLALHGLWVWKLKSGEKK